MVVSDPNRRGVNTCGSLIATRTDVKDAGYLWAKGGP
jgi:hypothetical protein